MQNGMAAIVGLWFLIGVAVADGQDKPAPAATLDELDVRLAQALTDADIPGASVTIIEDNQIVFSKGYGVSDVVAKMPVTTDTVFRAGSISKSWTGIAIMLLVEEGKLRLDDTLANLLPELKYENAWEATDPIRLVHLLEHTTGFDDLAFRHYLIEGKDIPLSDAVDMYGPYKSRWSPGTRMSYCNAGPVIAGRILEKVSGQSFQDFVAERLTGPLQMESAYWTKEPQIAARISKSYQADGITLEPFIDIPARPSGSLNVTSRDLARLPLLMLGRGTLEGVTYFQPETADRIEFPQTTNAARAGLKYGYGLGNVAYPGTKAVFHGHDGGIDGFVSKYEYAPGKGAGFVIMANASKSESLDLAKPIKDYLERDWPDATPSDVPVSADDLARWSGQYQTITPRQQLLALLTSLGQWQGASADEGGSSFSFNGVKRIHRGGGVFQLPDAAAPNLVMVDEPGSVVMYTSTGANRLVPPWEMWAKVIYLGMFALVVCISVIYTLIWLPGAIRRRLAERGGLAIRLIPALALVVIVAFLGMTMALLSNDDLNVIGRPSVAAVSAYIVSLLIPVMAAWAAFIAVRAVIGSSNAPRFTKALAMVNAVVAVIAAIYLYQFGWIGLKIWDTCG